MKKWYINMDYLRIACAFAIVTLHVTSAALTYAESPSKVATVAMQISTILMAWAVPCFFMLTGFLWLGNDKWCSYRTIAKHVLKFLIVLFTIGLFYALLEIVFTTQVISIGSVIKALSNVLSGKLWDHMWYVYAVIGVYLVLPLIKPFFRESKLLDDLIVVSLSFTYTILLPYVKLVLGYSVPVSFIASGWVFYVMLGGLFGKYQAFFIDRKRMTSLTCVLLIVFSNLGIILKYIANPGFDVVSYTSLSVALTASSVLVLATVQKGCEKWAAKGLVLRLSSCCWGIYLIHPLFINLMIKLFKFNPIDYFWYISIPITCVIMFSLSAVVTWVLRKIPLFKKYIF